MPQARQRIPSLQHDRPVQGEIAGPSMRRPRKLMIRYRLKCKKGHQFEAWFASSAAFDRQAEARHSSCATLRHASVEGPDGAEATKGTAAKPQEGGKGRPDPGKQPSLRHSRLAAHGTLMAAMRKLRRRSRPNRNTSAPAFPTRRARSTTKRHRRAASTARRRPMTPRP